jgi:hypothetical protein
MRKPPLRVAGQPVMYSGAWLGPTVSRWILPIAGLRRIAHVLEQVPVRFL